MLRGRDDIDELSTNFALFQVLCHNYVVPDQRACVAEVVVCLLHAKIRVALSPNVQEGARDKWFCWLLLFPPHISGYHVAEHIYRHSSRYI